jgi:hypothetical protein
MNEIYFGSIPLLQGPDNFFKLTPGVRPSFGIFRMSTANNNITTVMATPLNLILSDDREEPLTLYNLYAIKAVTEPSLETVACQLILADARILWLNRYGTRDYNTYGADRAAVENIDGDEQDYVMDNLNGEVPWTYVQIIEDLAVILEVTIDTSRWTGLRYPRNIIADGVPIPIVLQKLFEEMGCYLAVDLTISPPTYTLYLIGKVEEEVDLTELTTYASRIHTQQLSTLNPITKPKNISAQFITSPSLNPTTGDRLITLGSAEITAGNGTYQVPSSHAALFDGLDHLNLNYLTTIGEELATMYADSWSNGWQDICFAGVLSLGLNSAIHEIFWQSTIKGAFTSIKSFRPREEPFPTPQLTYLTYGDYLLGGGAGGGGAINLVQIDSISQDHYSCKIYSSSGVGFEAEQVDVYPYFAGSPAYDLRESSSTVTPQWTVGDDCLAAAIQRNSITEWVFLSPIFYVGKDTSTERERSLGWDDSTKRVIAQFRG